MDYSTVKLIQSKLDFLSKNYDDKEILIEEIKSILPPYEKYVGPPQLLSEWAEDGTYSSKARSCIGLINNIEVNPEKQDYIVERLVNRLNTLLTMKSDKEYYLNLYLNTKEIAQSKKDKLLNESSSLLLKAETVKDNLDLFEDYIKQANELKCQADIVYDYYMKEATRYFSYLESHTPEHSPRELVCPGAPRK